MRVALSAGGRRFGKSYVFPAHSCGQSTDRQRTRIARRGKRWWQEHGERRILVPPMRQGLVPGPAQLVRGSFRRIMTMRFRPANISVIIVDAAQPHRLPLRAIREARE